MNKRTRISINTLFVGGILYAILGCGQRSDRVQVSGLVTWEGEPLTKGEITFYLPQQIVAGAGRIVDGKFSFLTRPGALRVEVLANRSTEKIDPVEKVPRPEQYLPARYNSASTLTAEIAPPGPINLQFQLTAGAAEIDKAEK